MFRERVRKPTYEELEEELLNPKLKVLNRPIKIPRFDIAQNINAVDFNEFDLNNHNLKIMINARNEPRVLHDKQTQKDYELQNHDVFPEMYHEIDATGSDMGDNQKRTQTKRYVPKDYDMYSSAHSSSDKPSSPPSPHHISRPTSSEQSSEQEAPRNRRFGFFNSREWDMYRRLRNNQNANRSNPSSSSSSVQMPSSSNSSNVQQLTQREMARSRSHTSSEGSRGNKKSK